MDTIPQPVQRLIEAFSRLPGIGPKSASRLTYYLIRSQSDEAIELSESLRELREKIQFCSICFNITEHSPCPICERERDRSVICVVEEPLDVMAIERTREYRGLYHVLHGVISPMDGIGPEDLRIRELADRVTSGPVKEIILATNPSLEGENTAMYIQRRWSREYQNSPGAQPRWAAISSMRRSNIGSCTWKGGGNCERRLKSLRSN
jgi:recombination protein RecR